MFRKNTLHSQTHLFDFSSMVSPEMIKDIGESEEYKFYELIFCNINEEDFRDLYSKTDSRPNAPINCMVTSIFLQHRRGWTYDGLMQSIRFHLLTKMALGLKTLDEMPFVESTLFNFLNRLTSHFVETGENLLEKVFDRLTEKQIKELKLRTDIQRTDSFQAASNIRQYTRMQLLVEMLIRVYRVLSEGDKKRFEALFSPYVRKTSGQFIYRLAATEFQEQFAAIAAVYHQVHMEIIPLYDDVEVFKIFERVYAEHFTVVDEKMVLRASEEMRSDSLQSPDDIDATYRSKNGESYRGQVVNVTETANPENQLQLITDVVIAENNRDDSDIFHERVDIIKEKTPDLNEIHCDGAYGSAENDEKFEEHQITAVQTGIRGREAGGVVIEIVETSEAQYVVSCPEQSVCSNPTRKRFKAEFTHTVCSQCPHVSQCQLKKTKRGRVYYFTHKEYLKKRRLKNMGMIPVDRRTLRANVEATVSEFKRKMPNGKVKVRGAFRTMVFAFSMAVSINFGRIFRYIIATSPENIEFYNPELASVILFVGDENTDRLYVIIIVPIQSSFLSSMVTNVNIGTETRCNQAMAF